MPSAVFSGCLDMFVDMVRHAEKVGGSTKESFDRCLKMFTDDTGPYDSYRFFRDRMPLSLGWTKYKDGKPGVTGGFNYHESDGQFSINT